MPRAAYTIGTFQYFLLYTCPAPGRMAEYKRGFLCIFFAALPAGNRYSSALFFPCKWHLLFQAQNPTTVLHVPYLFAGR